MPEPLQSPSSGFIYNLSLRLRLILRLLLDRRVNLLLKIIPAASVLYLFNPIDIPTPLDDLGILWLGLTLFIELSPPEVVEEHLQALQQVVSGVARDPDEVIDAEVRVVSADEENKNEPSDSQNP